MIYPTEFDWAYLAGLVDGDGTIRVAKKDRAQIVIRLAISNTNHEVLRWVEDRFGGHVTTRRRNPLHADEGRWEVIGNKAADVLRKLQPYLKVKQTHAWLAQEAWAQRESQHPHHSRQPVTEEIMALRHGFHLASLYLNQKGAHVKR